MIYKNERSIAILLAVYNGGKYIDEQIQSVIRQTNKNWTLYIRDDNSTDDTLNIIKNYASTYNNIILIEDSLGNLGCRDNFFRLLEIVDSEYYMFCDADDVWFDDKIEQLMCVMQQTEKRMPDIPLLVYGDTTVCDENLKVLVSSYWKAMHLKPERLTSYNYVAVCCTAGGSCSVFNDKVKKLMFPLDNNGLMYDYWIALKVAKYGKLIVLNRPVKYYRQHGNNVCGVTLSSPIARFINVERIVNQYYLYKQEIKQLKKIGYGSTAKFYFYKLRIFLMKMGF